MTVSVKDIYHNHVRTALEKDGWTITHDPLRVERRKNQKLQIDPGAERLLGAEKGARKIAVEIKSFVGASEPEKSCASKKISNSLFSTLARRR